MPLQSIQRYSSASLHKKVTHICQLLHVIWAIRLAQERWILHEKGSDAMQRMPMQSHHTR
jgi:hypothetical protein